MGQKNADRWFILSAEHGLLDPRTLVEPYDATLNGASIFDRQVWSVVAIRQIAEMDLRRDRANVLAGRNYRDLLMNPLTARFKNVSVLMDGLMMG